MNLEVIAEQVRRGETVQFVARGGSMGSEVRDGEEVVVAHRGGAAGRGDVVLARVTGHVYLHLVSAVAKDRLENVYGILVR